MNTSAPICTSAARGGFVSDNGKLWKSVSMIMHSAPIKVPAPTEIDRALTNTELLMPTLSPIVMRAVEFKVCSTVGRMGRSGFAQGAENKDTD